VNPGTPQRMRAALQTGYGAAADVLRIVADQPVPVPASGEVLIRNLATSVNPIDSAVRGGYGSQYWESKGLISFPFIPGRDVAGIVAATGAGVTRFRTGDEVWAGTLSGGAAEYIAVPEVWVARRPKIWSPIEAASLPYVALTAWTALVKQVGLSAGNTRGKKIIVPRGAGGVGSFAIQWLKAWGAEVATICSTRNVALVRELGADVVIDRTAAEQPRLAEYDVAFDTSFDTEQPLLDALKTHADAAYVSIVTAKFQLIDRYGVDKGEQLAAEYLEERIASQRRLGRRYYWSFMEPDGAALEEIARLIDQGLIKPVVDRVYPLAKLGDAQDYCSTKQARGKIVVSLDAP
jgi:reticulon-4-interacting protein 1, mitochondrial